jgi:hypothetical protein
MIQHRHRPTLRGLVIELNLVSRTLASLPHGRPIWDCPSLPRGR